MTEAAVAKALGWVPADTVCGGYYLDAAFPASILRTDKNIEITGNQMLFAQHGTSIGRGKVTITRTGQLISADKAYLFRDPKTGKLIRIELENNVTLREPDNLVLAANGQLDLRTRQETLHDVFYRTTLYNTDAQLTVNAPPKPSLLKARRISHQGAWGHTTRFAKTAPGIYDLNDASYSTCPPEASSWYIKASHLNLDKNTGRGTARHTKLYIKNIPVFYTPWFNFPIDSRRKTGFLFPSIGTSNSSGAIFRAPFYWNIAPNYDATLTPVLMSKRGIQMTGLFRYLQPNYSGDLTATVLPNDRAFSQFQRAMLEKYGNSTDPTIQSEANILSRASDTRKALIFHNYARLNEHLTTTIHYNRVSDDYYLQDFSNTIDEATQNQLLQEATASYETTAWQLTGRLQNYQTLHPIDQTAVPNQYSRLPQFAFNGAIPNAPLALNPFLLGELTHFTITPNPGSTTIPPIGDRLHLQPGISRTFADSAYYITPRLQFALTKYQLAHVTTLPSTSPSLSLPIFDIHSGLYFDRDFSFSSNYFRQTLEPEIYYTYVPYKNQNNLPIFDTLTNTLNYDQLFSYNRFSGYDRIGDANQISYGITTRLIDSSSGLEKLRAGAGQIYYFKKRSVTIGPQTPEDTYNRSPIAGILSWQINPAWTLSGNSIWSVQNSQFQNQNLTLSFHPAADKVINLGYGFVRNGDINGTNLSQTDLSFGWPILPQWSAVGRWTQNWESHHFQNLLYGLQYDACCWAVRFVAIKNFTGLSPVTNTFQYDSGFALQFALKGLGNFGNSDPTQLLSTNIAGYQSNFGQLS